MNVPAGNDWVWYSPAMRAMTYLPSDPKAPPSATAIIFSIPFEIFLIRVCFCYAS